MLPREAQYLGFKVSKNGVQICKDKIDPILSDILLMSKTIDGMIKHLI